MGKATLYAALKLFFPPKCLHCKKEHESFSVPLCETCISFMEPLTPTSDIIITFEGIGPALSLITALKQGISSKLSSLLAAYMAVQYVKSDLPMPDLVTSVPTSFWRKWQMGQPASTQIASALAKLLDKPFVPLIQRKRQMLRQEFLTRQERLYLSPEEFQWKTRMNLHSRTILLIDDTITTGTTLACSAKRLWEGSPKRIIKMACVDRGYLKM